MASCRFHCDQSYRASAHHHRGLHALSPTAPHGRLGGSSTRKTLPMLPWLPDRPVSFPPVTSALRDPDGLLAAGGALTPDWLLAAYRRGIFPWFSDDQPVLWWSPDPRMVLFPDEIRVRRSLAKRLRNGGFRVTANTAFERVVAACAAPRDGQPGTWITAE